MNPLTKKLKNAYMNPLTKKLKNAYFESHMMSRSMVMKAIRRKVSWPPLTGCFLVPRIVSLIEPGALTVFSRSIIFLNKGGLL